MNRDRALQIVRHAAQQTNWPDNMVDVFVELGMLKLEHTKSNSIRLMIKRGFTSSVAETFAKMMDEAGLKIIGADDQGSEA